MENSDNGAMNSAHSFSEGAEVPRPNDMKEKALARLSNMIDRAIRSFEELQEIKQDELEVFDEDLDDLTNQFCAFREYWIGFLKE